MRLNLGCGNSPKKGYINLDIIRNKGVDVVHDLSIFPYPFPDNSFDEINMDNVLEHLDNIPRVMEEVYRICKHNAIVRIFAPHFASLSTYQDPTHKRGVSWNFFTFFDKEQKMFCDYAFKCNYKTLSKVILFPRYLLWVKWLANKFPGFYESNICFVIRPSYMRIKLMVIKR